jgi:2-polyprenyl-3-methyl-5-hydroxy-6-metoxy-1,4-benzoquinol methylase
MADQGEEGLLSPWLRKRRFLAVCPHIKGRILDFGCGSGGLAEYVSNDVYTGVDVDGFSIQKARSRYPMHQFMSTLPDLEEKFDSIVLSAVIEHVSEPVDLFLALMGHLRKASKARLIVTTPHPSIDWIHALGAAFGLFSKSAKEEHGDLLDRSKLVTVGEQAGLKIVYYRRFLFGANQLAVFEIDSHI